MVTTALFLLYIRRQIKCFTVKKRQCVTLLICRCLHWTINHPEEVSLLYQKLKYSAIFYPQKHSRAPHCMIFLRKHMTFCSCMPKYTLLSLVTLLILYTVIGTSHVCTLCLDKISPLRHDCWYINTVVVWNLVSSLKFIQTQSFIIYQ